jgi:molybdopterin converting factor small subunit
MKVNVKLFAVAREKLGRSAIDVEVPPPVTVARLRASLVEQFPALAAIAAHTRFAVSSEYAGDGAEIGPQMEVAMIPPVSGG